MLWAIKWKFSTLVPPLLTWAFTLTSVLLFLLWSLPCEVCHCSDSKNLHLVPPICNSNENMQNGPDGISPPTIPRPISEPFLPLFHCKSPSNKNFFRKGQKSQNVSDEQICTLICDFWFSCTLPSNDFMKDWFRLVLSQTITFSFTADFQDIKHVGFDLVCLFACHLPYRV